MGNSGGSTIRVLLVEDSISDAALIEHALIAHGYHIVSRRIESAAELIAALDEVWDIVISDFRLPQFNAISALEIVRKKAGELPFILVSQAVGEGVAVELMRAGANDYVLKSSPTRLASAVEREIKEARARRDAEATRQAHEKYLELVIESQINGIVVVDAAGVVTMMNRSAAEIFCVERAVQIGGYFPDFSQRAFVDENSEPIAFDALPLVQALRTGTATVHRVYGVNLADGTRKWINLSVSAILDATYKVIGGVLSVLDITETYNLRLQRKHQIERMRIQEIAINGIMSGIAIADARLPHKPITYVNDAFTKITGYDVKDAIGDTNSFLHGNDRDQAELKRMRAAIQNLEGGDFILRNYRKDGTMFYARLQMVPVTGADGKVSHLVAIQTDITEKMQMERELALNAERTQAALDGADLGYIDFNYSSWAMVCNERYAAMFGYTVEDFHSKKIDWMDLLHPQDYPLIKDLSTLHRANKIPFIAAELRMRHKGGHYIWVAHRGRVIERDAEGNAIRFIGTVYDITATKEHIAQIHELSQTLMRVSESERAEISSELHDTIGQSLVLTQLNLLKFLDAHDLRSAANVEKLLSPVTESLDRVREISRRLSPVHLAKLGLELALEEMLGTAEAFSAVKISFRLAAVANFFPKDWNLHVFRIVQEAVTNALKHSAATEIHVAAERVDASLRITICDNGKGIAESAQGHGIGLLMMRERCENLHAVFTVEAANPGTIIGVQIPQQIGGGGGG
ncbi:MAG: PAS domain S-box protein, partial [Spirochaetes bacterium]|nr:PAS domain S-box protein [Spirochaetota bacterium]